MSAVKEQFVLTKSQQAIFDAVEQTHDNYLLIGKPGTGKSVVTRALANNGQKNYTLCGPTGLAALNINGRTLHSVFRIPVSKGIIHPDYVQFPKDDRTINVLRYGIKYLIIDECSMVRADMFDYIDRLLRHVRLNDKPFGGLQVILIGDFFQLPPVVLSQEKKELKEYGYSSEFIFHSHVWEQANFHILQLTEVLRQQGDIKFIKLLHGARTGNLRPADVRLMDKLVGRQDDLRISLTGTNRQADEINARHLLSIDQPTKTFTAEMWGQWPAYPVDPELTLKVGAQVMVRKNRADLDPARPAKEQHSIVVNGTIGKVVEMEDSHVAIELPDGRTAKIYRSTWEMKVKQKTDEGKWQEITVAGYTQMPLSLAWAISIHKSQGQTFERVHIDATKIFAPGQMYVALSRCKTLAGISLEQKLTTGKFWPNRAVIDFYNDNGIEP